jgi:hypothetical protein
MEGLKYVLRRSSPNADMVISQIQRNPQHLHVDPNGITTGCNRDLKTGEPFYNVYLDPKLDQTDPIMKNKVALACASSLTHQAIATHIGIKLPSFVHRMAAIIETAILMEAGGQGTFNAEKLRILGDAEVWSETMARMRAKGAIYTNDPNLDHKRASVYAAKLFCRFPKIENLADALLITSTHPVTIELPQDPDPQKIMRLIGEIARATQYHEDHITQLCGTEKKVQYPGKTTLRTIYEGGIPNETLPKAAAARRHIIGLKTPQEAEQMQEEIDTNPNRWIAPGDRTLMAILQKRKEELTHQQKKR